MMLLFKGVLISAAGPAPNYDMQRVLSSKTPREASMMSAWVNIVLTFPRYFLIIGLTVLTATFFSGNIRAMGANMDFELILPYALDALFPWTAGIPDCRSAGCLHVELCGHRECGSALLCQRHLQALHPSRCSAQNLCSPQLYRLFAVV